MDDYNRTRITDFSLALREMDKCLEKNDPIKRKRSWTQKTPLEHLEHDQGHLIRAQNFLVCANVDGDYDDLVSTAVRGVMALEVYLRQR